VYLVRFLLLEIFVMVFLDFSAAFTFSEWPMIDPETLQSQAPGDRVFGNENIHDLFESLTVDDAPAAVPMSETTSQVFPVFEQVDTGLSKEIGMDLSFLGPDLYGDASGPFIGLEFAEDGPVSMDAALRMT
jgi:hypothetical protein